MTEIDHHLRYRVEALTVEGWEIRRETRFRSRALRLARHYEGLGVFEYRVVDGLGAER